MFWKRKPINMDFEQAVKDARQALEDLHKHEGVRVSYNDDSVKIHGGHHHPAVGSIRHKEIVAILKEHGLKIGDIRLYPEHPLGATSRYILVDLNGWTHLPEFDNKPYTAKCMRCGKEHVLRTSSSMGDAQYMVDVYQMCKCGNPVRFDIPA